MKQKYIDASKKYGFDITPLKSEILGEVTIPSGKIRIADCYTDLESKESKAIDVKNGSWIGKSFIRFSNLFLDDFIDDAQKIEDCRNEISKPYDDALLSLGDIKNIDSSSFIRNMLEEQKRKETSMSNLMFKINCYRDPEYELKKRFFNRMSGIVLVHKDYQDEKAFSYESICHLNYESLGKVSTQGSSIGLIDNNEYINLYENNKEVLSDMYYLGSSSDYELLDKLHISRKFAAEKVDNYGFISSTGYGGGDFDVRVVRNENKEIILIHINFVHDEPII